MTTSIADIQLIEQAFTAHGGDRFSCSRAVAGALTEVRRRALADPRGAARWGAAVDHALRRGYRFIARYAGADADPDAVPGLLLATGGHARGALAPQEPACLVLLHAETAAGSPPLVALAALFAFLNDAGLDVRLTVRAVAAGASGAEGEPVRRVLGDPALHDRLLDGAAPAPAGRSAARLVLMARRRAHLPACGSVLRREDVLKIGLRFLDNDRDARVRPPGPDPVLPGILRRLGLADAEIDAVLRGPREVVVELAARDRDDLLRDRGGQAAGTRDLRLLSARLITRGRSAQTFHIRFPGRAPAARGLQELHGRLLLAAAGHEVGDGGDPGPSSWKPPCTSR